MSIEYWLNNLMKQWAESLRDDVLSYGLKYHGRTTAGILPPLTWFYLYSLVFPWVTCALRTSSTAKFLLPLRGFLALL